MKYRQILNKFNATGLDLTKVTVAVEVAYYCSSDNEEFYEVICSAVKKIYCDLDYSISQISRAIVKVLENNNATLESLKNGEFRAVYKELERWDY